MIQMDCACTPALPAQRPREGQAFLWFRKSERPVALIDVATVKSEPSHTTKPQMREQSAEIGKVLRRA